MREKSEEDDGTDDFGFGDQIEYLANIGRGIYEDQEEAKPTTTAHAPTQIAHWRQQLSVGSKLDCLDEACLWWTSLVTDADGYKIKVRYDGFDARWDEWVDRGSTRIAPYMAKAKGGRESKGVSVNLKVVGKKKDKTGHVRRIYKQGFLVKQGKRFKSYKTRYFVLLDDGTMQYFKKMTDTTPAGQFNIKNMRETRRIAYPNKKDLYGFEIVTKTRTWRFQAHSNDVVEDWIGVIHAISKGVEPDDDEQHAVIYNGFINDKSDSDTNTNTNAANDRGKDPTAQRRATVQSGIVNRPKGGAHHKAKSFTRLSIQEEASSHPPINRAAFSQLMSPSILESTDSDHKEKRMSNITMPSNNKSRPDESLTPSPIVKTDDEKDEEKNR
eukprot:200786_1